MEIPMKENKVLCKICGKEIHPLRLEILPNTKTCVKCSQIQPYSPEEILGFNISSNPEENRINVEDFEDTGSSLF
jgi:hypothetical protein